MTEKHGSADMVAVWEHLVPSTHQVKEGLPSLAAAVERPWLFGYMPTLVSHSCEPGFLGTQRVFVQGSCHVLCASAHELLEVLPTEKLRGDRTQLVAEMEKLIASMATEAEEEARKMASRLNVWHGLVDATAQQVALVTAAGFVLAVAPLSSKDNFVAGAHKSFLAKGAARNLALLADLTQDAATTAFVDLLSVARAAAARQRWLQRHGGAGAPRGCHWG